MLTALAAIGMELVAAVSHRGVMHGTGWVWHKSHHQPAKSFLEKNDLYPLVFSMLTIVVMAVTSAVGNAELFAVATGVTIYGFAYLIAHDLVIHRRLGTPPVVVDNFAYFRWLREAHRIHHLYGREPYGFLFPIVPRDLRARAASDARDPVGRGAARMRPTVNAFSRVGTTAREEKTS
jgi:beta-carotene 3-hydroxylase